MRLAKKRDRGHIVRGCNDSNPKNGVNRAEVNADIKGSNINV